MKDPTMFPKGAETASLTVAELETILADPSATLPVLRVTARACQTLIDDFDRLWEEKRAERRDERSRSLKRALRSEANDIQDERVQLLDLRARFDARIDAVVAARDLARAQRDGGDPRWIAAHKEGLMTSIRAIPAKIVRGVNAKSSKTRDRYIGDAESIRQIAAATDDDAIELADRFLATFDPVLNARIGTTSDSRKEFLAAFVAAIKAQPA